MAGEAIGLFERMRRRRIAIDGGDATGGAASKPPTAPPPAAPAPDESTFEGRMRARKLRIAAREAERAALRAK